MTPRRTFAALYFVGAAVGLAAGTMLPWWASGAPAWVLAAAVDRWAEATMPGPGNMVASPARFAVSRRRDIAVRSATLGAFVGACCGAVAADLSEITALVPALSASAVFDGHALATVAALVVGVDAWIGVPEDGDGTSFHPKPHALVVYLGFLFIVVLPAIVEACS